MNIGILSHIMPLFNLGSTYVYTKIMVVLSTKYLT